MYVERGPLRGKILVCGMDAVLYLLAPESGVVLERTPLPAPITAPLLPTDDGLLIATYDGVLTRFHA